MKTYNRMIIGECLSGAQVPEFQAAAREYIDKLRYDAAHFAGGTIEAERGGSMVIVRLKWESMPALLGHGGQPQAYRRFVTATNHLLAGDFVVKIFEQDEPAPTVWDRLNQIAAELDRKEWSPDVIDAIADIVRAAGLDVRPPCPHDNVSEYFGKCDDCGADLPGVTFQTTPNLE